MTTISTFIYHIVQLLITLFFLFFFFNRIKKRLRNRFRRARLIIWPETPHKGHGGLSRISALLGPFWDLAQRGVLGLIYTPIVQVQNAIY